MNREQALRSIAWVYQPIILSYLFVSIFNPYVRNVSPRIQVQDTRKTTTNKPEGMPGIPSCYRYLPHMEGGQQGGELPAPMLLFR